MSSNNKPNSSRVATVSDVRVPLTVPQRLADDLRLLADRDCSTIAATARRLLARSMAVEMASAVTTEAR